MNFLDFMSDSPKNFIFQKESNKTNFGGIITLLYLLSLLLISIAYLYFYCSNEKYEINYSNINKFNLNQNDVKSNLELNPYKQFKIAIKTRTENKNLSERFKLYDMKKKGFVTRNVFFERKVSDFDIAVVYKCDNNSENNCNLNKDDIGSNGGYFLSITYNGFRLLHNETIPIQKNKVNFTDSQFFSFNHLQFRALIWEVVRYKEINGLFTKLYNKLFGNEKEEFIDGFISSSEMFVIDDYYLKEKNDTYKVIYRLLMSNTHEKSIQYTRKSIGIFDVNGNICTLIPLVNFISYFIYKFYSNIFNNYKIVEKILENDKKNYKAIQLHPIKLINKNENETSEEKINNDIGIDDYEINDDISSKKLIDKIPKFRFIQFFLNNINIKCFKRNKTQYFLDICNQILYKYMSVDYLLYNMIKLEKLFKDYIWNNPTLNNLENNELIIKLKQLY